jgi:hypothetical protein
MNSPSTEAIDPAGKPASAKMFFLGVLLLLAGLVLALGCVEVGLRLIGFSYRLYPEKLEFGYPDFKTMESKYVQDPDVFWTPKDYRERVQRLIEKPPQVIFMGDSCTEFGTYDREMAKLAKRGYPGANLKFSKLGVAGWASYQGMRQMERDVARIKPKVASAYFGWNDHWIGFGIEDKDIAKLHSPLLSVLERLRFVQLGVKAWLTLSKKNRDDLPKRVALPDFERNLSRIVEVAKANQIIPVLITAPTSQRRGYEPPYLQGRFLTRLDELVPMHQSYVAMVREVAQRQGAVLCDLEADFAKLPQRDLDLRYFKGSGIHLTPEGNQKIAQFLYECFERNGLFAGMIGP